MIKIIHTADVHLGATPDSGFPWEDERRTLLWASFKRLINVAKEERADILLICGDLFHRRPLTDELKEINYLFSSIPETSVVLCAGNHDHLGNGNPYDGFNWSENVFGLWSRQPTSVYLPKVDARVYGLSYYGAEAEEDLYEGVHKEDGGQYHILMMHGGDAKHSPVKKERLAAMDFDYIAMGHIHKPGYIIKNKAAYCGALVPIDRNDTGEHGYIKAELSKDGTDVSFVPFSPFKYDELTIYADEADTVGSIEDKIRRAAQDGGLENSYTVTVKGSGSAAARLNLNRLWEYGHIIELIDATAPETDMDELKRRYKGTLLEEYINELSAREDEVGRYALKEGVRAILGAMRTKDGVS